MLLGANWGHVCAKTLNLIAFQSESHQVVIIYFFFFEKKLMEAVFPSEISQVPSLCLD